MYTAYVRHGITDDFRLPVTCGAMELFCMKCGQWDNALLGQSVMARCMCIFNRTITNITFVLFDCLPCCR